MGVLRRAARLASASEDPGAGAGRPRGAEMSTEIPPAGSGLRFEGPRLVSAHAEVLRKKVIQVEGSGSLRELGDQ